MGFPSWPAVLTERGKRMKILGRGFYGPGLEELYAPLLILLTPISQMPDLTAKESGKHSLPLNPRRREIGFNE